MNRKEEQPDKPVQATSTDKPEIPKKPKREPSPSQLPAPQSNGKHKPDEPSSQPLKRAREGLDTNEERDPKKIKVAGPKSKDEGVLVLDDEGDGGAILIDDD